jgi:anhydro-N-acetylmuramic acid kinase
MKVLGLMSGTSADGIDAVLASFEGPRDHPRWRVLHSTSTPYPEQLRSQLVAVGQGEPHTAAALLDLAEAVTVEQARAARSCDPAGEAELVGCHGQTLWHRPPTPEGRGASWQLLQGPLLAQLLHTPVVFDLRAHDLALGGHGAPLVPAADAALLPRIGGWRAVLNLGGIANLTLLPPASGPERQTPVTGWDCGPANTLIDLAVAQFSDGRLGYDRDGAWAARGKVQNALIARWLQDDYFHLPPPKSTGRELFGQEDLRRRLQQLALAAEPGNSGLATQQADALATLTAFSAAVVAQDLERGTRPVELVLAGGGAHNGTLVRELRQRCRGVMVRPLSELGVEPAQREALGFALLAWWHHHRHPGSLPSVTGASRSAVLGVRATPTT